MSVVDEVRTAIQDFLAPELRTISARLDAIEKVTEARFDSADTKLDALRTEIQDVKAMLDFDRRLTKLESQRAATAS